MAILILVQLISTGKSKLIFSQFLETLIAYYLSSFIIDFQNVRI